MITGAFLAEKAAVVDNKLSVTGGVLASYRVGSDRVARLILVVLTQMETDGPIGQVELEIRPPDGDGSIYRSYDLPEGAVGGEIGFAYFRVEVTLVVDGRWVFVATSGPGAVSLPLTVWS